MPGSAFQIVQGAPPAWFGALEGARALGIGVVLAACGVIAVASGPASVAVFRSARIEAQSPQAAPEQT